MQLILAKKLKKKTLDNILFYAKQFSHLYTIQNNIMIKHNLFYIIIEKYVLHNLYILMEHLSAPYIMHWKIICLLCNFIQIQVNTM